MIGLLVMACGGPNNLGKVEPYLMDVRGQRPTSAEILAEVRERYRGIGGRPPILEQTRARASALEAALNGMDGDFKAWVCMRHWYPYTKEALAEMCSHGISRLVGPVMAPHDLRMSVGVYFRKGEEAGRPTEFLGIEVWHLQPGYLDPIAQRVRSALRRFPEGVRGEVPMILTAHSLPQRILEWNDPYPAQLRETVSAVMKRLGAQPHEFAYRSAISGESWLGPDASEGITRYAAAGKRHVLICPVGFVCEHVEILYDIDIVYRTLAESLNMQLERIAMPGPAPEMMAGLARLIYARVRKAGWL